jgi:hypothetical protein
MRALAVITFALSGCGGSTMPVMMNGAITLGTTALDGSGFVPLEGDQTLVEGAQGGFHIWVKYRVQAAPGPAMVKRTARRVSDDRLLLTTMAETMLGEPGADGWWELPTAVPSFMCPSPLGVKVEDEPAQFQITILDMSGKMIGQASAEATPRCPSDSADKAAFCHQICDG